jgi:hypothetical protein
MSALIQFLDHSVGLSTSQMVVDLNGG